VETNGLDRREDNIAALRLALALFHQWEEKE